MIWLRLVGHASLANLAMEGVEVTTGRPWLIMPKVKAGLSLDDAGMATGAA